MFSPRVEETAPGTVVLDLEGLERLFGSPGDIAARLAAAVADFGLHANIALASNPDTAVHLARGYAGITVVEPGNERTQLSGLAVDVLSPSPEILETLDRWGIRTLGAFAKLPAVQISERLGQEGVRLQKLSKGPVSRLLVPRVDELRFEESMEFDAALESLEPLTFILGRLLDRLCVRLQTRAMATHEVTLHLGLEKHDVFTRVLRLPVPVHNSRLLLKLSMLDLESHPPGAAIERVTVKARHTLPRVVQNGLFIPLSPEPEKLELTLARIASIVGQENVGTPEILDTHRPQAFRIKHFNVSFGSGSHLEFRGVSKPPSEFRNPRSLRIFRPPLEATVQLENGIPIWIAFSGFHGRVEIASGPWHSSGDWWNAGRWDREEWDVEVFPTALYHIYLDRITQRWFAEGVYD